MEDISEVLGVHKIWDYVIENLTNEFGPESYRNWFSKLFFKHVEDSQLIIKVPSNLVRDWVLNNYSKQIRNYWNHHRPIIYEVTILVDPALDPNYHNLSNNDHQEIERIKRSVEKLTQQDRDHKYDIFNIDLDPRFNFDNFVVGTSNQLAYAAAKSVAESREVQPGCNPLFLYGGVGLGKTHLMQAIAFYIKENDPTRKVIYLSAEKFMYQFIRALRDKSIMSFKEQFRSVDVLMIDDVQFICGKDSTQEEFFHTFNALIDNKRQMVISCDRSPSDLENMEERIRSRLGWGLVADVHSTNYELRYGILQAKIDQIGLDVPKEVIEFLADKITSNVRELEGALNKVIAHSRLLKSPITIELTQQTLSDLIRYHDKVITIDEIQKIVAHHYEIRITDMTSERRVRTVARPRQLAMYLSKKLTMKSLVEIGKKFGGKDHTTVMHAIKKVEDLIKSDPELAEDANILTKKLKL